MKKSTIDYCFRGLELIILLAGVIAASVLAYQQLSFNRQLVDADYKPSLEVKEEKNQIRLYNRGSKLVSLQNFRVGPSDKSNFSTYQKSIFPGDSIDLDIANAIKFYLDSEKPLRSLLYSVYFSVEKPQGGSKIYEGIISILVDYDGNSIKGVKILGGDKRVPVWELPLDNFTDLYNPKK